MVFPSLFIEVNREKKKDASTLLAAERKTETNALQETSKRLSLDLLGLRLLFSV